MELEDDKVDVTFLFRLVLMEYDFMSKEGIEAVVGSELYSFI